MSKPFQAFSFKPNNLYQQNRLLPPTSCRTPSTCSRSEKNSSKDKGLKDYGEVILQAKSFINLVSHRQKLRDLLKKTKRDSKSPSLFLLKPSSDMNEFPEIKKSKRSTKSISVLAKNKCKLVYENKRSSEEYQKGGISWIHYKPIVINESPAFRAKSCNNESPKKEEKIRNLILSEENSTKNSYILSKVKAISGNENKKLISKNKRHRERVKTEVSENNDAEENEYIKSLLIPTYSKYECEPAEDDSPTLEFQPRY
ncbi:unnamed protein product [Blepharisma stoltei]|uniref:Uncharacterized protein n=1 Tax=Blepharisma stoltei TaxID=1481888 RepID=A0AAU9KDI6_9CILI|nr:unnamed protein product [Blepharisma stoltei]